MKTQYGDWSDHDNKRYTGKLDRIYVSRDEEYEVEYFIDQYLKTRGYGVTNKNRDAIAGWIEQYPGKAPVKRDELNDWLDGKLKKRA